MREMAPRHPNSFKVGEKYGVVEHRAQGRRGRCGARGESIGKLVFKVPAVGVGAEEIRS